MVVVMAENMLVMVMVMVAEHIMVMVRFSQKLRNMRLRIPTVYGGPKRWSECSMMSVDLLVRV